MICIYCISYTLTCTVPLPGSLFLLPLHDLGAKSGWVLRVKRKPIRQAGDQSGRAEVAKKLCRGRGCMTQSHPIEQRRRLIWRFLRWTGGIEKEQPLMTSFMNMHYSKIYSSQL